MGLRFLTLLWDLYTWPAPHPWVTVADRGSRAGLQIGEGSLEELIFVLALETWARFPPEQMGKLYGQVDRIGEHTQAGDVGSVWQAVKFSLVEGGRA